MFWGLSSALDFQEEYFKSRNNNKSEINILLIGSCDARHILKTVAQAYRHEQRKINIFIIENCLELIARQLILLSIAFENPQQLGLLEKTRIFLEIYGNTLIRPSTSKYMISKSNELIKMITNLDYMTKVLPNVSFDGIKYRERDYIEMLLQFWRIGNTNQFNICELWDKRIRNALGCRYDAKFGVFDWDYSMRLKDVGGATVSSQEFKHFRSTGVAFTWLEVEVCRPNNTLAAGVLKFGDQFCHRGYLGDIVTGPYIAYGLSCEDKEMMQVSNKAHIKRATDITKRNVMRMMFELQSRERFDAEVLKNIKGPNLGLVTISQLDAKISEETDSVSNIKGDFLSLPSLNIEHVNISFHSPTALDVFPYKENYMKHFDVIFSSHCFVDKIDATLLNLLNNNGLVVIESKKFLLDLRKDDIRAFEKKIEHIEETCNMLRMQNFDPLKDEFVKLKMKI